MDDPEELDLAAVADQMRKEDRESPALRGARHDEKQTRLSASDWDLVAEALDIVSDAYEASDCPNLAVKVRGFASRIMQDGRLL